MYSHRECIQRRWTSSNGMLYSDVSLNCIHKSDPLVVLLFWSRVTGRTSNLQLQLFRKVLFDTESSFGKEAPLTPSDWASECPDVKNYKWWLNPAWHRMLYSCTHVAPLGVKGLNELNVAAVAVLQYCKYVSKCQLVKHDYVCTWLHTASALF